MAGWEMKLITAEARRLMALAEGDDELRADLRALAEAILSATEAPRPGAVASETSSVDAATSPPAPATETDPGPDAANPGTAHADRPQAPEPLHELTLGRARPARVDTHQPPGAITVPSAADDDLREVSARCRVKAEGARRAAARLRRLIDGADAPAEVAPEDPDIAGWADRFADSFYWIDAGDASRSADVRLLDDLGGCFEAVAEALSSAADCRGRRGALERLLPLLAQAQSALRRALQGLQIPDDPDQLAAFEWARQAAARHNLFIKRYMRADDQADPSAWPDLLARIEEANAGGPRAQQQRPRIDRVRRHLDAIRRGDGDDRHWRAIILGVDAMIAEGVPPSSREVRDLLLPWIDDLPDRDDLPAGFRLVLREIDRFLAAQPLPTETPVAREPGAEVAEARRLLRGRKIVLIGGVRRPEAQEALRDALGLGELVWVETKEHQAVSSFEPAIARPDVALVLLAIRWSSHAFGDVKRYCERHGKPMVRLPGGYGPNQVAAQIIAQCGERLDHE